MHAELCLEWQKGVTEIAGFNFCLRMRKPMCCKAEMMVLLRDFLGHFILQDIQLGTAIAEECNTKQLKQKEFRA